MVSLARWSLPLALAAGAALSVLPVLAAAPIQRVDVRLTVEGGEPHSLVVRRMLESIGSAAERLLIGRDSDAVAQQEAALAGILKDVVDRVVRGYGVVGISFQTGVTTVISVRLQPRMPVLGEPPVVITMPSVHPDARPFVLGALEQAVLEIRRVPARLPVEALEWAGPILERRMTELIEAAAPGFTGIARIESGPDWRVSISVGARDSRVIREIAVRFRSSSIPFVLLEGFASAVTDTAEPLRGLPVVFAAAQQGQLEDLIARRLGTFTPVREYGIVARPVLQVAEVTYLTVLAESTRYRARFEARLNFGIQAPVPDVRAQLGVVLGSVEPFMELTLIPSNLAVRWTAGIRLDLGANLAVGTTAGFDGRGLEPFVIYRLSPDLQIRAAYAPSTDILETTLTYRLNEFLAWEGVTTSRGLLWLRLVSNL